MRAANYNNKFITGKWSSESMTSYLDSPFRLIIVYNMCQTCAFITIFHFWSHQQNLCILLRGLFHIISCVHFNLSDIQLSHKVLMLVTNKRLPCESMWHVWSDLCPWVYNMCPLTWYLQEMAGLECGHQFCAGCWTDYLTSKIIDEGMGQTISCAAYACDILVDDVTVM